MIRNTIVLGVVVVLLVSCLMGAFYMGYRGYGVAEAGSPSVRGGSLFAPTILGGGPNSGK